MIFWFDAGSSRMGRLRLLGTYLGRGATFGHNDGYQDDDQLLVLVLGPVPVRGCRVGGGLVVYQAK
jgi:hypothetical protein